MERSSAFPRGLRLARDMGQYLPIHRPMGIISVIIVFIVVIVAYYRTVSAFWHFCCLRLLAHVCCLRLLALLSQTLRTIFVYLEG